MKERTSTNLRKWTSLAMAILVYNIVHEGAHMICALIYGTFKEIKFMGIGVQIVVDDSAMNGFQLGIFCLVGSVSTLIAAYLLLLCTKKITAVNSKYIRAIGFYTTLALLVTDPLYLSVLYRFFGGGDMNGIVLLGIPEIAAEVICGIIGILNIVAFFRYAYPKYKAAFTN